MQRSPAIVRDFFTTSAGARVVFSSRARAAAWAKEPPLPIPATISEPVLTGGDAVPAAAPASPESRRSRNQPKPLSAASQR